MIVWADRSWRQGEKRGSRARIPARRARDKDQQAALARQPEHGADGLERRKVRSEAECDDSADLQR